MQIAYASIMSLNLFFYYPLLKSVLHKRFTNISRAWIFPGLQNTLRGQQAYLGIQCEALATVHVEYSNEIGVGGTGISAVNKGAIMRFGWTKGCGGATMRADYE